MNVAFLQNPYNEKVDGENSNLTENEKNALMRNKLDVRPTEAVIDPGRRRATGSVSRLKNFVPHTSVRK